MRKIFNNSKQQVQKFLAQESSGGILLAIFTVIAMLLANSALSDNYFAVLHHKLLGLSIHHWINDGLMVIFFFVVGMEIKKELVAGELSSPRRAALPMIAAIGGVVLPATIYYMLNPTYPDVRGWGIPMATDIAFAVGVLSFFGKRVSLPLKIFLLALAIVDDLIAVIVIAFFYTKEINGPSLGIGFLLLGLMLLFKYIGIRSYIAYTIIGILTWLAVLKSGVHATIAGVAIGLLAPLHYPKAKNSSEQYSPLQDLVHTLHPWVSYLIMPVFALANAGVKLELSAFGELVQSSIHQGVALGLFFGKPIGIFTICFLAVKLGIANLPNGVKWKDLFGVGILAGIGFTMALFVSGLALYPEQEIYSKTGILLGSLLASLVGSFYLYFVLPKKAE